jgi:hypothetical protein
VALRNDRDDARVEPEIATEGPPLLVQQVNEAASDVTEADQNQIKSHPHER